MAVDKTCPHCTSTDTEEICEYKSRYLYVCRSCSKDFSVPKPQDQIEREREAPPEERWK